MYLLRQLTVFWIGGFMAFNNEISIGQYTAITAIFLMVLNSLFHLSGIRYNPTELWVSLERLNDVLVRETEDTPVFELTYKVSTDIISIKNLSFRC